MDPNNNNPFNPNPSGSSVPTTPSEPVTPAPGMDPSGSPSPTSVDWNNPTSTTGPDVPATPSPFNLPTDIGAPSNPVPELPPSDSGTIAAGNPGLGNDPTINPTTPVGSTSSVPSWPPQDPPTPSNGSAQTNSGEPIPTFTPPQDPSSGGNPLGNTFAPINDTNVGGASTTTPDLSGGANSIGAAMGSPTDPMAMPSDQMADPVSTPDSAPTDLSHLVENSIPQDTLIAANSVPQIQPENLVVPPPAEPSQVVTSGPRGLPKWVFIVVGVILLLAVAGGSAYFILGFGKPTDQNTSVPIEQSPLVNPPKALLPSDNGPSPTPANSGLVNLATPSASPQLSPSPVSTVSGTSAIDLLRQRQR